MIASAAAAHTPSAHPVANRSIGKAHSQPEVQGQGDRWRGVLAPSQHFGGHDRHHRAAALALVAAHLECVQAGLPVNLEDPPDLALQQPTLGSRLCVITFEEVARALDATGAPRLIDLAQWLRVQVDLCGRDVSAMPPTR